METAYETKPINERKSRASVFISYAHEGKVFARRLHDELSRHKIGTWLDQLEVLPGNSLTEKIASAIKSADTVIVVISDKNSKSQWLTTEIALVISQQAHGSLKKIIPVLIDKYADIPFFLSDLKYLDFSEEHEFKENFVKLVEAIRSPALSKATEEEVTLAKIERIRAEEFSFAAELYLHRMESRRETAFFARRIIFTAALTTICLVLSIAFFMMGKSFDVHSETNAVIPFVAGVVFTAVPIFVSTLFRQRLKARKKQAEVNE